MSSGAQWLTLWAPAALIALLRRHDLRLGHFTLIAAAALFCAGLVLNAVGWLGPAALEGITAISAAATFPALIVWGRAYLRRDLPRLLRQLGHQWRWAATCALLWLGATGSYYLLGKAIGQRWSFRDDFTLFDSDAPRYLRLIQGRTGEASAAYKHPAYVLLAGTATRALGALNEAAPIAANASAAGLALALAAAYFRRVTGKSILAVLLSVALGITAGHLVFGAIPETYAWSAAGLILMQLLLAARCGPGGRAGVEQSPRLRHFAPAAALAVGVTLTHLVAAALCYALLQRGWWRWRRLARFLAAVATGLALLLALQNALFPAARVDLRPQMLQSEKHYVTDFSSTAIQDAVANAFRGVLTEGVIAAQLRIGKDCDGHAGVHMEAYTDLLARVCVAFWWVLLAASAALTATSRASCGRTLAAVVLGLAFALTLHVFYGNAHVFLFSCTFVFYLFALIAHALVRVPAPAAVAVLSVWIGLCALNNSTFCARLLELLSVLNRFTGAPG